ncbi:MAG: aspartate aminotransferase, partial [Actinomycetota bacterium]|nr:aspartate aminotransferase [Actinomycetota bacterium]
MSVDTARRLIDLSCGQVLDPPHPVVRGALHAAADAAALPYAPRGGEQALRSAVAAHYTGRTGRPVDASAVTVVPGVRQGLFAALAAAARGREVLMPAPHWSHYPRVIDLAG